MDLTGAPTPYAPQYAPPTVGGVNHADEPRLKPPPSLNDAIMGVTELVFQVGELARRLTPDMPQPDAPPPSQGLSGALELQRRELQMIAARLSFMYERIGAPLA